MARDHPPRIFRAARVACRLGSGSVARFNGMRPIFNQAAGRGSGWLIRHASRTASLHGSAAHCIQRCCHHKRHQPGWVVRIQHGVEVDKGGKHEQAAGIDSGGASGGKSVYACKHRQQGKARNRSRQSQGDINRRGAKKSTGIPGCGKQNTPVGPEPENPDTASSARALSARARSARSATTSPVRGWGAKRDRCWFWRPRLRRETTARAQG